MSCSRRFIGKIAKMAFHLNKMYIFFFKFCVVVFISSTLLHLPSLTCSKQQQQKSKNILRSCKNKKSYCDQAVEGASVARLVQPPCMRLDAVIAYSDHLCDCGEDKQPSAQPRPPLRANELDVRWPPTSLPAALLLIKRQTAAVKGREDTQSEAVNSSSRLITFSVAGFHFYHGAVEALGALSSADQK